MSAELRAWLGRVAAGGSLMMAVMSASNTNSNAEQAIIGDGWPVVTQVMHLRRLDGQKPGVICRIHLEGDVWWVNSIQDRLVLRDASGAAELEMDLAGQPVTCDTFIINCMCVPEPKPP